MKIRTLPLLIFLILSLAVPALAVEDQLESFPQEAVSAYSVSALDEAPNPNSPLSEAVTALFGTYTPRTQTVTQHLEDGSVITYQEVIHGLAGLDWPWLVSVGLFALVLFSLLRMIGGLLKL